MFDNDERLNERLVDGNDNQASKGSLWKTLQAGGLVTLGVTGAWLVLNLAAQQLVRALYLTEIVAPKEDNLYDKIYQQLQDSGVQEPQLSVLAAQYSQGNGYITYQGTPTEIQTKFHNASAIACAALLVIMASMAAVGHYYDHVDLYGVHFEADRRDFQVERRANVRRDELGVAGVAPEAQQNTQAEPDYLFGYIRNKSGYSNDKINTSSYQYTFALEKTYQYYRDFLKYAGISLVFSVAVLFEFNAQIDRVHSNKFNEVKDSAQCASTLTSEQCDGSIGNEAEQQALREDTLARLRTQYLLLVLLACTASPVVGYVAYKVLAKISATISNGYSKCLGSLTDLMGANPPAAQPNEDAHEPLVENRNAMFRPAVEDDVERAVQENPEVRIR